MKMKIIWLGVFTLVNMVVFAQEHPSIMLTKKKIGELRKGIERYPMMATSYKTILKSAEKAVARPPMVPAPVDDGGGATHEQHKRNYQDMLSCGIVYQVSGEKKYAQYVRDVLLQYAAVYKQWPRHPKRKEDPGGKMFWQNLNDCVWMVYTIQGYDCVYDFLSKEERKKIETDLFEPVVNELAVVNGEIFNKIHNHGTWSVAAVGMAGLVCNRSEWVEMALKGSSKDGKAGFLAQLDQLFSPDGYYSEGPYYQRYALLPFVLFAKAIHQYRPGQKIFDYRNGLLKKAVDVSLQCTYTSKVFFPLNDAMKDKTYETEELVYAVDIAYADMNAGDHLLDIAAKQGRVLISDAGLQVAKAIAEGKTVPFEYRPIWISDGAQGTEGGLGILRSGKQQDQTCVVFEAASQGMGHGHFDRLNMLLYDNNTEVFSDYGAARFLNIETKSGGRYTTENNTWAKQSIAHNTLVVDETSHFEGKLKKAEATAPELLFFEANERFQVVSAREKNAYKGVEMTRTLVLFTPEGAAGPLVIDVFLANASGTHSYDLPFWYQGHVTYTSFPLNTHTTALHPLGKDHGYQHIWLNATGKPGSANGVFTFLQEKKFYTTSFLSDTATTINLVTAGANDPDFNIRNEKGFIISKKDFGNQLFIQLTEPHGKTNPVAESITGAKPGVSKIAVEKKTPEETVFSFFYKKEKYTVTIQYNNKTSFISIK